MTNYEKTIDGLFYVSQQYLSEILGVERHTIKGWQTKYKLPTITDEKYRLCCAPIYINLHLARTAFGDWKRFPKDNTALIVAIGLLSGEGNTTKTTRLLQKGLNLSREKALLTVGMAAEWIRVNLKSEYHVRYD